MSKLAHSDDRGMATIAVRTAIEDGNEDAVWLERLRPRDCASRKVANILNDADECHRPSAFITMDGQDFHLCAEHAEEWAIHRLLTEGARE
jgi:hypothetical protein